MPLSGSVIANRVRQACATLAWLLAVGASVPLTHATASAQSVQGHLSWSDIQQQVATWRSAYPHLVRVQSLGKTVERRDIPLLQITDHRHPGRDRPEVLLVAGVHPREQGPIYTIIRFVRELLEGYGRSEETTALLRNTIIWVAPVLNVDGKVYDFADTSSGVARDWRKNRRRNADSSFGVDLNRNFPVRWGGNRAVDPEWRASTADPAGNIYEGPAPLSEPESRALATFISSRPIRAFLDLHSPLHSVNMPVFVGTSEAPRYARLVAAVTSGMARPYPTQSFRPGEDAPSTARSGNTGLTYTWAYYTQGTYSLNLELAVAGSPRGVAGRYPSPAHLEEEYDRNGRQALLGFVREGRSMPARQRGSARIGRIRVEPAPVPGAEVTLTPEIHGDGEYSVLVSEGPEMVVESEFRVAPFRTGFRLRVAEGARPGTPVRLALYVWDGSRGRTIRRFTLSVADPVPGPRTVRWPVQTGCLEP